MGRYTLYNIHTRHAPRYYYILYTFSFTFGFHGCRSLLTGESFSPEFANGLHLKEIFGIRVQLFDWKPQNILRAGGGVKKKKKKKHITI